MQHISSINAHYGSDGALQHIYPPPPIYHPECPINVEYDTLPVCYPMRQTTLGPNSLKHLYRGPWYYPLQEMDVPDGTLYDVDSSVFWAYGKRRTYGKKIYPFTHRSPREVREYADCILPYPKLQEWTQYPVVHDGAWGR